MSVCFTNDRATLGLYALLLPGCPICSCFEAYAFFDDLHEEFLGCIATPRGKSTRMTVQNRGKLFSDGRAALRTAATRWALTPSNAEFLG